MPVAGGGRSKPTEKAAFTKCGEGGATGTLLRSGQEQRMVWPLWNTVWQFPRVSLRSSGFWRLVLAAIPGCTGTPLSVPPLGVGTDPGGTPRLVPCGAAGPARAAQGLKPGGVTSPDGRTSQAQGAERVQGAPGMAELG